MRVVIDTNVLVSSLSSRSPYHWLIEFILSEKIDLLVSEEILFEYEEILTIKYAPHVAHNFLTALQELPSVHLVKVYFHWNLLRDEDDNKFVDCAIAGNANYIVTHDKDFNTLKQISFPEVNLTSIVAFEKIIKQLP